MRGLDDPRIHPSSSDDGLLVKPGNDVEKAVDVEAMDSGLRPSAGPGMTE